MENKILKAIDKGLLNVLSTDIEDQDIDFDQSDIDNNGLVVVNTLNDIIHYSDIDMHICISSDVLTLMIDAETEISLHEYRDQPIEFIHFHPVKENEYHDIIISTRYLLGDTKWVSSQNMMTRIRDTFDDSDCYMFKEHTEHDYDGYAHTYQNADIANNHRNIKKYNAIEYCQNRTSCGMGMKGYLPAMGELMFLYKYQQLINDILKFVNKFNYQIEFDMDNNFWWSSTEHSYLETFVLVEGKPRAMRKDYDGVIWNGRTKNFSTLPLFKKLS